MLVRVARFLPADVLKRAQQQDGRDHLVVRRLVLLPYGVLQHADGAPVVPVRLHLELVAAEPVVRGHLRHAQRRRLQEPAAAAVVEVGEEAEVRRVAVAWVGRDEAADEVTERDVVVRGLGAAQHEGRVGAMTGRRRPGGLLLLGWGSAGRRRAVTSVVRAGGLGALLRPHRYCLRGLGGGRGRGLGAAMPEVKLVCVSRAGLAVDGATTA